MSVTVPRRRPASGWLEPALRRRRAAYGAGPGVLEALGVCRRLAAHGLPATIGYFARPGESARAVADVHLAALEGVARDGLDSYVSVKLSALAFDAGLLDELARAGAQAGRRVHVDALAPETADRTWDLLGRALAAGPLGTTLPGRWRRSVEDAARVAELGLPVRVVKGQWEADGSGAADTRDGFLAVVDRLTGHRPGVSVATHDARLLAESLRRLRATGTRCEVELFYGLPFRAPARIAAERGVPVRIYVPYGDAGAPYDAGTLRARPAAAWWLVQDVLLGKDKMWRSLRRSSGPT